MYLVYHSLGLSVAARPLGTYSSLLHIGDRAAMSFSGQTYHTPSRISSVPSSLPPVCVSSRPSSSLQLQSAGRPIFSSPLTGSSARILASSSRPQSSRPTASQILRHAVSRAATPYHSSPRLPIRPPGSRLSLRPSATPSSSAVDHRPSQILNHEQHDGPFHHEADALNEVIMAIDVKENGNLGCVYYVAAQETLYLLEDVAMAGLDLVETLLLHAKPTTILVSSRAPSSLLDCLARGSQGIDGNRGDLHGAYILRNLNSTDFRYDVGREKLLCLNLEMLGHQNIVYTSVVDDTIEEDGGNDGRVGSKQGRLMRLGASVNLDSRLTIGCAGAVLGDIQRRKTAQYLPNDPDALVTFRIRTVESFSLFDSMFVNADALISLQVLRSELHPNSHQRGPNGSASGAKESLSIYGLFQHLARTPQGRMKLRQTLIRPSTNIDVIKERQKTISFFLRPGNAEALMDLHKKLVAIKNMKPIIALLQKGVENPNHKMSVRNSVWAALQRFAAHSLQIREIVRQLPGAEKIAIIRKVVEGIEPLHLCRVGGLITETIDFEQSVERGRTAVKQGVDAELDKMKRNYEGMEHLLTAVSEKLQAELPEWARTYVQNCVFYPQLGFLTLVSVNPETGKGSYDGEGLNDVWERMFVADGSVYYKNRQMKEMDERFGDAYCLIIEVEITHGLAVKVLEREQCIITTSDLLGEFDSLLALAIGCGQYNWVAPEMTTENIIHVEGGRHPLQELVVPTFIANDCRMSGGQGHPQTEVQDDSTSDVAWSSNQYPSSLILTGPNHSGKSVYLKQIALIVYLAHVGCYVPADRALIGITDRILTRVATRESVTRDESAFAIDLRQVAFAMNFATRRSLVLVDEFGKGTNSLDGVGLVTALLQHFTSLGHERPKVLAATHFHEIFENHFIEESLGLAFAHMDIRLELDAPTLEDQVTYLFQLVAGRSISSFGSRCAAMNGLDKAVVERAESIMLMLAQNEDLEVVCSKLSADETQTLEEAEAVARDFVEYDINQPPVAGKAPSNRYRNKLEWILAQTEPSSRSTPGAI
ncbi:muts domain V-domain-containing protein [Xylariomycetidae sp. FL2044]|nr:muts domain V-domain-containing protein [Xylariomycetidae sp. FL2044]